MRLFSSLLRVAAGRLCLLVFTASAEFQRQPDDDTLWLEDGIDIRTGDGKTDWRDDGLRLAPAPSSSATTRTTR